MLDKYYGTGTCEVCLKTYTKKANNSKTCGKECHKKRIALYEKTAYLTGKRSRRQIARIESGSNTYWDENCDVRIPAPINLKYPHTRLKL